MRLTAVPCLALLVDLDEVPVGIVEVRGVHVPIRVGPGREGKLDALALELLVSGVHVVDSEDEGDVAASFALWVRNPEGCGHAGSLEEGESDAGDLELGVSAEKLHPHHVSVEPE
jgi:hypothetical protein